MAECEKIKLYLLDDDAFVWTADDWKLLRRNYRIVGHLTGSLPRQPKQNTYQGLPLKLLREEATLLLEKGIAELVTCNIPEINQSQIELYNHNRESNIMEQAKIIAKEKNERDLFYREQNHLPCDVNKEANKDISDDEIKKLQSSAIIHISTANLVDSVTSSNCRKITWKYPDALSDKFRYAAYRDLWYKGFYITPGRKFGGDYLIYADDPYLFHSRYVVRVIPSEREISTYDMIAFGRLCTNVKKIGIFCSVVEDKVKYLSVKWTGMG